MIKIALIALLITTSTFAQEVTKLDLVNLKKETERLQQENDNLNEESEQLKEKQQKLKDEYQNKRREIYNISDKKRSFYLKLKRLYVQEEKSSKLNLKKTKLLLKKKSRQEYKNYRNFLKCINVALLSPSLSPRLSTQLTKCNVSEATYNKDFQQFFIEAKEVLHTDLSQKNAQKDELLAQINDINKQRGQIVEKRSENFQKVQDNFRAIEKMRDDLVFKSINKVKTEYPKLLTCNTQTPTLDLEQKQILPGSKKKGIFYGLPRDHQDSVGTCFSNVAKNLLYAASNGQVNASFLELALQYQEHEDDNVPGSKKKVTNIDGGNTCDTIEVAQRVGYCPKKFSPLETGDEIHVEGGLFKNKTNLYVQANVLDSIRRFLEGKSILEKNDDIVSETFIKKSKEIFLELQRDENIALPLPELANFPITENKLPEIYVWNYQNTVEKKNKTTNNKEIIIGEATFKNDFIKAKRDFLATFLLAQKKNPQTPEQKEKIFREKMKPFFDKYYLNTRMNDEYYSDEIKKFARSNMDDEFKKKVASTLKFYQTYIDPEMNQEEMFNLYTIKCVKNPEAVRSFSKSLMDLISVFKESKLDPSKLYDKNGNFISNKDFLELAIAPGCINTKNRRTVPQTITCIEESAGNDIKKTRERIIASLYNNLPVGNTFMLSAHSGHINTIVGFRYNSQKKKCEYKIRESQTGSYHWDDEESLVKKARTFTYTDNEAL